MDRDIFERLQATGMTESYLNLSLIPWIEHHNATIAQEPQDAFQLVIQLETMLKLIRQCGTF